MQTEPLVSVITPVYNGGEYLAACIESVLAQTFTNFEYIIVNNCSTDRSLDIALAYAKKDPRVQVHSNMHFVGVIENHNNAFRLISPAAKYCKVVSGDDIIFPDCITQMVEVGKSHPSAGIIGAYQQSGKWVKWQGFPYPNILIKGRELGRQVLLSGGPTFGFGSPTSLLYRADLVRKSEEFYPNLSAEGDTSACFKHLKDCDFGFVYQVLCYERTHEQTQSAKSAELNRYASSCLRDLKEYGLFYLGKEELERNEKARLNAYYEFLVVNMFLSRGKEFWDFHRSRLKELGYPFTISILLMVGIKKAITELLNLEQAMRKFRARFLRK